MKRQYVEIVTCVSLVAYAVIVLAGQAAHLIPGLGCHCHSGWRQSPRVEAINHAILAKLDSLVGQNSGVQLPLGDAATKRSANECNEAIDSNDGCPICDWFALAQQMAAPADNSFVTHFVRSSIPRVISVRRESVRGVLPRGPPLWADSENSA